LADQHVAVGKTEVDVCLIGFAAAIADLHETFARGTTGPVDGARPVAESYNRWKVRFK
jgi:hypothetical protein